MFIQPSIHSARQQFKQKPALQFSIRDGNMRNWFFKNSKVAVQLVITSGKPRIIAAFPAGNSGIGLWFKGKTRLKLLSPEAGSNSSGETVNFSIETHSKYLILKKIILNNIRILRNAPPLKDLLPAIKEYALKHHISEMGTIYPTTKLAQTSSGINLIFTRKDFNQKNPYRAILNFPKGTEIKKAKTGWRFSNSYHFVSFHAYFSIPHKPLTPVPLNQLILPGVLSKIKRSGNPYLKESLRNLAFLSFKQKFLAGGWRFFTYFGRDTEMTLLMLQNCLTPEAYQIGLQSILNRVSPEGEVAHEEDVGSLKELDKISKLPSLHYQMLDENLLLPILFSRYLDHVSLKQAEQFLKKTTPSHETNTEVLLKNFNLVISQTRLFAKSRKPVNLIHLKHGQGAGNWRDSRQGLAYGQYPGDVNCWLAPLALNAIEKASKKFPDIFPFSKTAERLAKKWNQSRKFFMVHYSPEQIRTIIKTYLNSPIFTKQEKAYFLSEKIQNKITLSEFLNGKIPAILKHGVSFPVLSLNDHEKPIPVMNSDPVFELFLGSPSRQKIQKLLPIFSLPYPIGLKTPVGLLVSNPAYTLNPKDWRALDSTAYQGTVVWVWAESMLRLGLLKQEKKKTLPSNLRLKMKKLNRFYAQSEKEIGPLAFSELYTWQIKNKKIKAVPYGMLTGSQTEADAIQLWSCTLPALYVAEQH
jgi:hypothetical protein